MARLSMRRLSAYDPKALGDKANPRPQEGQGLVRMRVRDELLEVGVPEHMLDNFLEGWNAIVLELPPPTAFRFYENVGGTGSISLGTNQEKVKAGDFKYWFQYNGRDGFTLTMHMYSTTWDWNKEGRMDEIISTSKAWLSPELLKWDMELGGILQEMEKIGVDLDSEDF